MKYYVEITVMNGSELTPYQIWTQLYTQLHLAFVEQQNSQGKIDYGVSFPQYRVIADKNVAFLGFKVRVFAQSAEKLQALKLGKWLEQLTDYVHYTSIKNTPETKQYACYYRDIPRLSMSERIKHQAKRHQVSLSEARTHLQNYQPTHTPTPFISLKSLSNHHDFRLHIGRQVMDKPLAGQFSTYGLSREASVPEF